MTPGRSSATAKGAPEGAPALRLRLVMADGVAMGWGKAALLEGIERTGSIAAAGRGMGMSYKRAWGLVAVLNASFRAPLVLAARGGPGAGGAQLTETGAEVLALYRRMEAAAAAAAMAELAAFRRLAKTGDG